MKRNLNLLAFVLLLLSCQKSVMDKQGSTQTESSAVKGNGSSLYTYLTVEIDDAISSRISSDASTTQPAPRLYVNSLENVRAEFQHSSGDFYMMTNTLTSKTAKRFFRFPENSELEGKNDYRIRLKDEDDVMDGETNLQEMNDGAIDNRMVMRLWSFDNKGNKLFDIIFNPTITEGQGSNYVTVTKTNVNMDEKWVVSPNDEMNAVIRMPDGTSKIRQMPFQFILRKK